MKDTLRYVRFRNNLKGKKEKEVKERLKSKTQIKFDSINTIHQTNANRIITITTNDVQCESSVKCIRESSIESISKLF